MQSICMNSEERVIKYGIWLNPWITGMLWSACIPKSMNVSCNIFGSKNQTAPKLIFS